MLIALPATVSRDKVLLFSLWRVFYLKLSITSIKMCVTKKTIIIILDDSPLIPMVIRDGDFYFFLNGKSKNCRNFSVSPFVLEVVTIVIANPKTSLISSSGVSGNIVCSLIPSV